MKIFTIKPDFDNTQVVIPDTQEIKILEIMNFDCFSRKNDWPDIEWHISNPKLKEGDFYSIMISGALVFNKKVYDSELMYLFEMSGEILPIKMEEGEDLYLLNVLDCTNALNKKLTKWNYYPDGTKRFIKDYVFHNNRMTESSIFKIPETSKVEIFCYEGIKDPELEFKYLYEKLGFTGLEFEEVYSE